MIDVIDLKKKFGSHEVIRKRSFDSLRKKDRGFDNEKLDGLKKEFKPRRPFDNDREPKKIFKKRDSNKSYEKRDEKPKRLFEGRIRREK